MVDLPLILEEVRKRQASSRLLDLSVLSAQYMEEHDRKDFVDGLRRQAGIYSITEDEPDIDGLAKLKAMLGG
jgi:hypothetical protein